MQNCINSGDIHGYNIKMSYSDEHVGGVVGYNFGKVINCENIGDVEGYDYVGGVAGASRGSTALISNCFNNGSVTGGGVVGLADESCTIQNCYNTGIIYYDSYYEGSVAGYLGVGVTAENCYWLDSSYYVAVGYAAAATTQTNIVSFNSGKLLSALVGPDLGLVDALNSFVYNSSDFLRSWEDYVLNTVFSGTVVTASPSDTYAEAGDKADFTALAAGDLVTYQWQVSTDCGGSWNNVTMGYGATTPTYTTPAMTEAMDGYQYRCIFSGSCGSSAATLSLETAPCITTQPVDTAANAGEMVTFTCAANGTPSPDYEWYHSDDGGETWHDSLISGPTLALEMFSTYDGFKYYCKVSNSVRSVDSDIVTLSLAVVPAITIQPEDAIASEGATVTFTVAGSGVPNPDYQWQVSMDGSAWSDVTTGTGGITASYTTVALTAAMGGYSYRCVVSNIAGSVNSDAAILAQLTLSSSVADGKIYTGGHITLTPSVEGGTWDWDEDYFSATFNSPATFTALKAGTSTITYTVGRVSTTYDVPSSKASCLRRGRISRLPGCWLRLRLC